MYGDIIISRSRVHLKSLIVSHTGQCCVLYVYVYVLCEMRGKEFNSLFFLTRTLRKV